MAVRPTAEVCFDTIDADEKMIAVEKGDETIETKFPYNAVYVKKVKAIEGRKWHPERKYWSISYDKGNIKKVLKAFDGKNITIDSALQEEVKQQFEDL